MYDSSYIVIKERLEQEGGHSVICQRVAWEARISNS